MPSIQINAEGSVPRPHRGKCDLAVRLARIAPDKGSVILMIHGYKYLPHHPLHCPHRGMMSRDTRMPASHTPSWPHGLGFEGGHADKGLAVTFGWSARGALWAAQRRAVEAGQALAQVLAPLHALRPDQPIHVIAHSMITEVALETLHHLPPGVLSRILALSGVCYGARAYAALATPSGRAAEFFNITSRQNDLFDVMFEWLMTAPKPGDRASGQDMSAPNALTIELDCHDMLFRLGTLGLTVASSARRGCHWISYTRSGVMRMHKALLRAPEICSLPRRCAALHKEPTPRFARLLARPSRAQPLPFGTRST